MQACQRPFENIGPRERRHTPQDEALTKGHRDRRAVHTHTVSDTGLDAAIEFDMRLKGIEGVFDPERTRNSELAGDNRAALPSA